MQGQCLCGKTVFSFELINHDVHACHCSICRKQTSDANMTIDIEAGSLKFLKDSNLSLYPSSEWAERGFCNHCGTSFQNLNVKFHRKKNVLTYFYPQSKPLIQWFFWLSFLLCIYSIMD